jgi:hypothetical protein
VAHSGVDIVNNKPIKVIDEYGPTEEERLELKGME